MKWYLYVVFFVCILFSAFFSSAETAYSKTNQLRLKKEKANGNKRAAQALRIVEDYDGSISALLLGNNLVNIAASSVATIIGIELLTGYFDETTVASITTGITFVVLLLFSEFLPKVLASRYSYNFSKLFALPVIVLKVITFPIIWLVTSLIKLLSPLWTKKLRIEDEEEQVTDDELIEMIDTIEEGGFIDSKQGELLKSAVEFTVTTAYEVMTPRVDVAGFDIDDDLSEMMEDSDIFTHSRIPVYEESLDNIIGVINSLDILKAIMNKEKINIKKLMEEPYNVHASKPISEILNDFKESHHHLAIVKDEFGGTAGILTLEDIVEELVGEIWDEMDVIEEQITEKDEGILIIDGSLNIEDFFVEVGIDEDEIESDYVTVGGWCIEQLGRFAKKDDQFAYENLVVTIIEASEFTVDKIQVEKLSKDIEDK